ncbi:MULTISPECIES: hypothetical protein [unclassified Leifsonia]|uniref:hypothetical protein n=1 Tax=unclassified Leifsonia TaxID=2663824 RepID=UPI000927009C|nr:hypothetical protein [Leifsonia sp. 71-9]OJX73298.1 MAG: hypothetical protein BGO91_16515 [Leifsonia sp. 71-9]
MSTTAQSPVKVDAATDRLISDAAHFLGRTKKDVVSDAVREYVDAHRAEINDAITESLARLDGSRVATVSMLTGMDAAELDELGGLPAE